MNKGNVLVIGNSGVGKSTLINAVLGENVAKTGWGSHGITGKLEIYEANDDNVPFRVIDTIGFEPSFINEYKAIQAVKKWSKEAAKEGKEDNQVNVIWFCVDGTKRKLFPRDIKSFIRATSMWKSVPVITVITKSYSTPERAENIEMVARAFAEQKKGCNLKKIMPVVAALYPINDEVFVAPEGISELIDETNKFMPEGLKAAERDLNNFILDRKRALAQAVIATATTAAAVVGAVPIPFPDAAILIPTETLEVTALSKLYGIRKGEKSKEFLNSLVEAGTV